MFIKKLSLKSVLLNLLLLMPIVSFAAISEQDRINFNNTYGSEVDQKTANKILSFCGKDNTDISSCLSTIKAQPSVQKPAQKQMGDKLCCINVSGFVGEYAFIQGQAYCIPPC